MIHAGICEDEKVYSDRIAEIVNKFLAAENEMVEMDFFTDGNLLLQSIGEGKKYDLLFLDLQLENSDGMETAAKIREMDQHTVLIFVTGMENRAVEGYAVEALDYVVKSQLEHRLETALQRFLKRRRENALYLETVEGETVILSYKEILWVESENRGTRIVTGTQAYSSSLPIGKITEKLPGELFQEIHKSVYARIDGIKRISTDQVIMCNNTQLPLSRRKRKEVMKRVLEAVKGRM